jgi:hypothetical protein
MIGDSDGRYKELRKVSLNASEACIILFEFGSFLRFLLDRRTS